MDDDDKLLQELRAVYETIDPVPSDLTERVMFALGLDGLDAEVARLQDEVLIGSGARASDRTRTITFDCVRLSIMISVAPMHEGLRIDGWLAPPGELDIELRTAPAQPEEAAVLREATADAGGRFVFENVPHGLVQIVVLFDEHPVVTPSIVL
ncbi:hypothetical protein [Hamadaea tsunoensis]|uniref:hypothetical protein n=1 Tax=Hamadaea tsunoensis TaxID=53368 RepID=UPI000422DF22|nr:hypothetical protein [Hamadaea tsunoensis]